jgi:hypothetical protein
MWQTRTTGQTRWLEHELALKYSKPHQASNKQRALISDRCTRIQFSYKIRLIILDYEKPKGTRNLTRKEAKGQWASVPGRFLFAFVIPDWGRVVKKLAGKEKACQET